MIWYLNFKLDLNLSCAMDFQNLNSMVTCRINWRRSLALITFQHSSCFFLSCVCYDFVHVCLYEGCSKRIAYFYLETSNFKLAQERSFHDIKELPVARNAKLQRCIYFLKASRYADLGTVIRYWWIAYPSACHDCYFRPARNYFKYN